MVPIAFLMSSASRAIDATVSIGPSLSSVTDGCHLLSSESRHHLLMKLGSKYDLLTPRKLKYKQIYWRKYLQSVEKIQW